MESKRNLAMWWLGMLTILCFGDGHCLRNVWQRAGGQRQLSVGQGWRYLRRRCNDPEGTDAPEAVNAELSIRDGRLSQSRFTSPRLQLFRRADRGRTTRVCRAPARAGRHTRLTLVRKRRLDGARHHPGSDAVPGYRDRMGRVVPRARLGALQPNRLAIGTGVRADDPGARRIRLRAAPACCTG